ncbi:MAG: hypothetical protein NWF05_05640 [Candidatus Bathyarchaeota archaeon]|nr:hypothetical protein [Candidatus Bathyarchaeota archaeon]
MSETTIRKLRKVTDGVNVKSYFFMPPLNWLNVVEKKEGKKILHFAVKAQDEVLVLNPVFVEPTVSGPKNTVPEKVTQMLKQGNLMVKLREVHKGRNIYRIINVPRSWVKAEEGQRNRAVVAVRVTTEPESITVTPIFGSKLKPR